MTKLAVGFTQQVQLQWLEWAAQLATSGIPASEAREELQIRLRPIVSVGGDDNRSNRGKVVGILMKTWLAPPRQLAAFHREAIDLFASVPKDHHVALHWGMAMVVYPFFGMVVDTVGRLLTLQGTVNLAPVVRRAQEVYGQRKSIERGTERAFYTLHDWGVIKKAQQFGIYNASPHRHIEDQRLTLWLLEAALISKDIQTIPWKAAWKQPSLFHFSLDTAEPPVDSRLEIVRQGLHNDVIVRR